MEIFVEGMKRFVRQVEPADFKVSFYGVDYYRNRSYEQLVALREELPEVLCLEPRVTSQQALELQRDATALLCLAIGRQTDGLYGTKIYEYLASGRPTLVIPSVADPTPEFFPTTRYQIFAVSAEQFVLELKTLYEAHRAGVDLSTGISETEIYSISRQRSSQLLFATIAEALS